MDMKKLAMGVVAMVVAIVIVVTCAIPIISDSVSTEDTFTNEGRYYVDTEIEDDVTITMNYDIESDVRSWYIDGELLTYADYPTGAEYVRTPTVAGTDNLVFRTDGRCRGLTSSTGSSDYTLSVTNESITLTNYVGNAPLFVASVKETDNVMRNDPGKVAYVLGDSEIIACGYTQVAVDSETNTNAVISFKGSVDDGVEVTVFDANNTFTVQNVSINADKINGYKNLYGFTSVTFDVVSENDSVTSCTYSMVVLPAEVIAEKSVHADGPTTDILSVIPVMMVLGIVIGAIALFIKTKRD